VSAAAMERIAPLESAAKLMAPPAGQLDCGGAPLSAALALM
jgi:hypothetical protein